MLPCASVARCHWSVAGMTAGARWGRLSEIMPNVVVNAGGVTFAVHFRHVGFNSI